LSQLGQGPHRGQLNALRPIRDGFGLGPDGRSDSAAQISEFLVGNIETERT
jgi:hypothetical protein